MASSLPYVIAVPTRVVLYVPARLPVWCNLLRRAITHTVGRGEMLRCPWHGWEYDIRTGQSWWDPGRTRVRSYDVTIEAGEQLDQDSYRLPLRDWKRGLTLPRPIRFRSSDSTWSFPSTYEPPQPTAIVKPEYPQ